MSENESIPPKPLLFLSYLLLALVLAVDVYVRIRLLPVPLERDEGEFAYMGQLLLKGIPPYIHAYTMKLPGASAIYAFFMSLFGQTPAGIHLGLLIVNATCIWLVYILARRLLDRETGIISCACYAVLSLSQTVYGVFAHATHFVVMFALAGLIALLRYLDRRKGVSFIFLSGLCFGLSITMKQHAALLAAFAFLFLIWRGRVNLRSGETPIVGACLLFLLGTAIPYSVIVVWMIWSGIFPRFWFWTVQYASEYASDVPFAYWMMNLKGFLSTLKAEFPLWLLAVAGFALLCIRKREQTDRLFLFGFLLFSFIAVCPGFYFRGHYFIMLLPAVAILIGYLHVSASRFLSYRPSGKYLRYVPILLLTAAIAFGFYQEREYLFSLTPREVSSAAFGSNPFPEALQIAGYIKEHTSADDRIAVFGSEPEIYFYADRLSATGHIYMYNLMENQPHAERMQLDMIREIEAYRPKYIVMTNVQASWLIRPSSPRILMNWGRNYVNELYDLVGVVDIINFDTTRYLWNEKALGYTPASDTYLTVFKRKGGV
jgi:hypothetical protein